MFLGKLFTLLPETSPMIMCAWIRSLYTLYTLYTVYTLKNLYTLLAFNPCEDFIWGCHLQFHWPNNGWKASTTNKQNERVSPKNGQVLKPLHVLLPAEIFDQLHSLSKQAALCVGSSSSGLKRISQGSTIKNASSLGCTGDVQRLKMGFSVPCFQWLENDNADLGARHTPRNSELSSSQICSQFIWRLVSASLQYYQWKHSLFYTSYTRF